jgi:hypothetical protein
MVRTARRSWATAGSLALAAAVLTGCGDDASAQFESLSDTNDSSANDWPDPVAAETTEATAVPEPVNYDREWQFTMTSLDGSSIRVTLQVAGPYNVASAPLVPGLETENCVLDEQRDAVLPFEITRTSTTEDFDSDITVFFYLGASEDSDEIYVLPPGALDAAAAYSDGANCSNIDGITQGALSVGGTLLPGGFNTTVGQFVIHDYFTPENPDGDSQMYDYLHLLVPGLSGAGSDDQYAVTDVTGPGMQAVEFYGNPAALFPLDGE